MAKFHCVHRQPILPQTSTSLTFVRSLMTDGPSMRLLHFLRKLRKLLQVALAPTGGLQYVTRYRIVPCTAAIGIVISELLFQRINKFINFMIIGWKILNVIVTCIFNRNEFFIISLPCFIESF